MPAYTLERKAFIRATIEAADEAEARALFGRLSVDASVVTPGLGYVPAAWATGGGLELSMDDDAPDLMEIDGREPD